MADESPPVGPSYKRKKKPTRMRGPNNDLLTPRELNLLALKPLVDAGEITLAEATTRAGFSCKPTQAGHIGQRTLTGIKDRLSKNEHLQEILGLKGASMEDAAAALATCLKAKKTVKCAPHKGNIEGLREVPDYAVISDTAQFLIEAHGAMPENKVISEHHSFEQRVAIVAELKQNPQVAMELFQKLLKNRTEG